MNFGWNTFNGTLITGGGSGSSAPPYVISPFKAIQDRVIKDKGILRWDFWSENPTVYANAEACLVFVNNYASESFDRTSLTDAFSDRLVRNVATNCSNTIVIIHSAGIRVVDDWIDHANVTAVVYAGLPGQESGYSLVDVLYGDVSPSGRLPFTVAKKESDYGSLLNSTIDWSPFPQSDFSEGLYIDYRAFDRDIMEPRFEFGYGLSYTEFGYAEISVAATGQDTATWPSPAKAVIQGGHPDLWNVLFNVNCIITNTGEMAGVDVPQLYVGIPNAPARQLRGFESVALKPNESTTVTFPLTRRDLSIWNVVAQQWELQSGDYCLWVGASSRDIKLGSVLRV